MRPCPLSLAVTLLTIPLYIFFLAPYTFGHALVTIQAMPPYSHYTSIPAPVTLLCSQLQFSTLIYRFPLSLPTRFYFRKPAAAYIYCIHYYLSKLLVRLYYGFNSFFIVLQYHEVSSVSSVWMQQW